MILDLVLEFVMMDPLDMGPVKHDNAPCKRVIEKWQRYNNSRSGDGKLEFVDEVFGPASLEFDRFGCGPFCRIC